ncbi:hypothetical protein D3C73_919120 [compost metagenome]
MKQHSLQLCMCVPFRFELMKQVLHCGLLKLGQQFLDAIFQSFRHLVMRSELLGRGEEQLVEERLSKALPGYWPAARGEFAGQNVRRAGRKVRQGGGKPAMRK